MSLSHCAGSVFVKGPKTSHPALLTKTSIGPKAASAAGTAESTLSLKVISQWKASAAPPASPIAAATFRAASRLRSKTATRAPSPAKRRQVAPPMPPPPPVTTTVLSSNRFMSPPCSAAEDRQMGAHASPAGRELEHSAIWWNLPASASHRRPLAALCDLGGEKNHREEHKEAPTKSRKKEWTDSLPPCGGGPGRGVTPSFAAFLPKGKIGKVRATPTPTRPHKGGGRARAVFRSGPITRITNRILRVIPKTASRPERRVLQRQGADAFSGDGEDRVGDRRRDRRRARFAESAPFLAARQHEMRFDDRRVRHQGDRVGVEIALLDAALADRDLAEQRGRQPVEHGALDLHRRGQRIDQMAAVDAGHHPLDLDRPAVLDRDLGDLADDRAERLVDRETPPDALGERLPPVALVGEGVEHGEEVRASLQQRAPVFERIALGREGQLVDKTLDRKSVLRRADRAPEHHRHM